MALYRKFIDTTTLELHAGKGGAGCVSFRREKFIERGGPDGGDGGRGGNIYFIANARHITLGHLHAKRIVRAQDGAPGGGQQKSGKNGPDYILQVPVGTLIKDSLGHVLLEFCQDKEQKLLLRGGIGGRGNARFATPSRQAPRIAQKGLPGERGKVHLEVRLLADVGLVGFPNAGKSTLLRSLSQAKAKVGDYAFTTVRPQVGVIPLDIDVQIVMADIPGILEGASQGKGLGIEFLKHIKRCTMLLFLIDINETENAYEEFEILKQELAAYHPDLPQKAYSILLTKTDLCTTEQIQTQQQTFPPEMHPKIHTLSAITRDGLEELRWSLLDKFLHKRDGVQTLASIDKVSSEHTRLPL